MIALCVPLLLPLSSGCSTPTPEAPAETALDTEPQAPDTKPQAPDAKPQASGGGAPPQIEIEYNFDSNRRLFDDCDPVQAAERYEELIGKDVSIQWAWKDETQVSANLQAPARVIRIDPPWVVVNFDRRVPNVDLYASVLVYSGHIKTQADGAFGVDPCSATLEEGGW